MHIILLTRFHSNNANSQFILRLAQEAASLGHTLSVVNPAEVMLQFTGSRSSDFPVKYNGLDFPEADLILPSARWDDSHTWQIAETLQAWQRPVVMHNRVPLGDHVTMARLYARREIPTPRTWVLTQAMQLAIVLPEITFPCMMRSRFGGSGRRLVVVQHSGEAYAYAESLAATGQPFLVQDLPQPVGEDIRALVVGTEVVAAIHRKAPEGFVRPRENNNTSAERIELTEAEKRVAIAAAQLYGAPFCSVGLLRTSQGPLLLEVARAPTLEELENAAGANLARKVVQHLAALAEKTRANVVPLAPRMAATPR